jgi:hypothetical protein
MIFLLLQLTIIHHHPFDLDDFVVLVLMVIVLVSRSDLDGRLEDCFEGKRRCI